MNRFFGLPVDYLDNLAKIMKGSVNSIGCSINNLVFRNEVDGTGKKVSKGIQVQKFIKDVNQYFQGIMRFELAGSYVIPLVYNRRLLDSQKLPFSSDVVAMAFLILTMYLCDKQPITEQMLKEKLMRINKENNEINKILRELVANFVITRNETSGIITYEPTNILYALIPENLIFEILDELGENSSLEKIMNEKYFQVRNNIKSSLESLVDKTKQDEEDEKE